LLIPSLRAGLLRRASSITTNPHYEPTPLSPRARRQAGIAEALSFAWVASAAAMFAVGLLPTQAVLVAWAALSIAAAITDLRGEILHRFNDEGSFGTLARQVRDSINVPHTGLLSALVLPVGIGYHALHHLDMVLPYHAMPEAHERIMKAFPGSLYHRATVSDIGAAVMLAMSDD